jgi:hypothetical protein
MFSVMVSNGAGNVTSNNATLKVNPIPPPKVLHVAAITMSVKKVTRGKVAIAAVRIVDSNGAAFGGARVTGNWSRLTSGSSAGTTNASGIATLTSPKSALTGTFTFTVASITAAGYSYDASKNVVTSASITSAGVATNTVAPATAQTVAPAVIGTVSANQPFKLGLALPAGIPNGARVRVTSSGQPAGVRVSGELAGGKVKLAGAYTFTVQFQAQTAKASQQYTLIVMP